GRQTSLAAGTSRTYTPGASGNNYGKQRTIICYNCKGEGHMSKQCTKPKRKRDDLWFKDKVLLVQAQASGQILHEEELAFLADPGIPEGQATQTKSVNDTLTAELERYKEQVKVLNEGQNVDLKSKENISDSRAQSVEIDLLKQTLSEHLKEKESLMQTVTLLKNDFKKEESRNIDREIALEKRIKQLDNIKAQQLEPKLYDGNVIKNTSAIVIPDSEEALNSVNSSYPTPSSRPTNIEVPKELPKVNMVNTSLKKLKHHLVGFDVVVNERTMATAITKGSWGFKHTKRDEIIPFVKALKDLFNTFDQYLIDELSEVQNVFHQMEQAVKQHRLESKTFEDDLKKLKGKDLVDNAITKHTIDPEMLKIDVEPITPKLLNKRTGHSAYIKHFQEEVAVLMDLVDHVKANYPLDNSLESAFRITITTEVPLRKPTELENETHKPVVTLVYSRKPRKSITNVPVSKSKVIQIVLWYLDSGCSKHMIGGRSQLINFVNKFLGTVKFGNDHVAKILGYGDYQIGNVTISRVYYVEGLGHNLFSVRQFCDSNLEVAFRQHTCFIRNLEGVDLLTRSQGNNMYTLSLGDMMASSPICLLSKVSKTKSWLWHRCLSHLNFGAINHLARQGLVRGLPKLKFETDHLCSACAKGKSKKKPHKPKSKDTNQEKLYLLHMDVCGLMGITSVNGKKYILVIVDDYSRFTWVKCLRSKDEAPDFIIKFLKMI
ncbi:retrovirus-related pol polyprotein from transposon TNT 1-94, partial [Tanacetum coccineum]